MNLKRTVLCLTLTLLALPATAAAKSQYGLRLGESISVQGEIAPTLFAGNPCVDVVERAHGDAFEHDTVGATEIEADREYWQMALFAASSPAELDDAEPTLILRDLDTGETARITARLADDNVIGAYATLSLRFPHPGRWTIALDDGSGRSFDYSGGTVISTVNGPTGAPLDAAELEALGNPGTCTDDDTASAGAGGDSIALPLALAVGAAGVLTLALILRRRTLG